MAETFNVSKAAMHWRLYNLRLIEDRPQRSLPEEETGRLG